MRYKVLIIILLFVFPLYSDVTFVDSNKKIVKIIGIPKRVVVTSPEVQEILYSLGVEKSIIANVSYCDYPEKLKSLPKVGDFKNPNVEKIISLNPDLIIITDYIQQDTIAVFDKLKYKVIVVYISTIKELKYFIKLFGRVFKKESKAYKLNKEINIKLKRLKKNKKIVFPLLWGNPIMTAGKGTIINEIIERAGGVNLGSKAGKGYININEEFLIRNKPDYLLLCGENIEIDHSLKFLFKKYKDIKIIKDIDPDHILRAGPRVIDGIIKLNNILK